MINIVGENFSILQFSFMSFYHVLMSNTLTSPNFTDLVRMTETMILAEPQPREDLLNQVRRIYEITDDELNLPLASVEMLVFYQLQPGAGLNKEIEIDGKNYKIIDLYYHLDRINGRLIEIVVEISKKYNLDIPLSTSNSTKLQF